MVLACWLMTALVALLDWYAVRSARRGLESVAKPATMLALGATALAMGATDSAAGRWLIVGIALGLVGDVFLLDKSEPRFLGGLAAFLLGHLAYVATFLALGLDRPLWALVGLAIVALAGPTALRIVAAGHREGGAALAGPVTAYILVISAMVLLAWASGRVVAGIGASVFLLSDTLLALDKFVQPRRWAPLAVIVTYHLGQALMAYAVLRA